MEINRCEKQTDPLERLNWIYNSDSSDKLAARYDLWAPDYERDLIEVPEPLA